MLKSYVKKLAIIGSIFILVTNNGKNLKKNISCLKFGDS